jgi:tetratricopeptide (TPR) repeat protein
LAGRGAYHATALYMLGLSQMYQDKLAQAVESLTRALDVWVQHKRPFDQLYARHALSDVYWRQGRIAEAVELAESVLAEAETMEHSRRDLLLEALRRDLDKYRAVLPDQPKSKSI